MEVKKQDIKHLFARNTGSNSEMLDTVPHNRGKSRLSSRSSSDSVREILLEDGVSDQNSLLNYTVMENACVVTRKRRSRAHSVDVTDESRMNIAQEPEENIENSSTSSENILIMQNAISAIRRRRSNCY